MHCNRIEFVAALTQLHLGANNVGDVQEVGLDHVAGNVGNSLVQLVGAKDASAGDAAEQTKQLGCQSGSLQLVDGCGELVADVGQGVGTRAQLAEVVSGIGKATVQQGHDLLVGSHVCGHQVAAAATPGGVAQNLGFRRGDGVEEWDADAGAASTGIKSSVALHNAGLNPLRLLEDTFSGVLKELGAGNKVGEECSSRIIAVKGRHGLAPVRFMGLPHRG